MKKIQNLVAKHMKKSGSGIHTEKVGKNASRHKQKQEFKKSLKFFRNEL